MMTAIPMPFHSSAVPVAVQPSDLPLSMVVQRVTAVPGLLHWWMPVRPRSVGELVSEYRRIS